MSKSRAVSRAASQRRLNTRVSIAGVRDDGDNSSSSTSASPTPARPTSPEKPEEPAPTPQPEPLPQPQVEEEEVPLPVAPIRVTPAPPPAEAPRASESPRALSHAFSLRVVPGTLNSRPQQQDKAAGAGAGGRGAGPRLGGLGAKSAVAKAGSTPTQGAEGGAASHPFATVQQSATPVWVVAPGPVKPSVPRRRRQTDSSVDGRPSVYGGAQAARGPQSGSFGGMPAIGSIVISSGGGGRGSPRAAPPHLAPLTTRPSGGPTSGQDTLMVAHAGAPSPCPEPTPGVVTSLPHVAGQPSAMSAFTASMVQRSISLPGMDILYPPRAKNPSPLALVTRVPQLGFPGSGAQGQGFGVVGIGAAPSLLNCVAESDWAGGKGQPGSPLASVSPVHAATAAAAKQRRATLLFGGAAQSVGLNVSALGLGAGEGLRQGMAQDQAAGQRGAVRARRASVAILDKLARHNAASAPAIVCRTSCPLPGQGEDQAEDQAGDGSPTHGAGPGVGRPAGAVLGSGDASVGPRSSAGGGNGANISAGGSDDDAMFPSDPQVLLDRAAAALAVMHAAGGQGHLRRKSLSVEGSANSAPAVGVAVTTARRFSLPGIAAVAGNGIQSGGGGGGAGVAGSDGASSGGVGEPGLSLGRASVPLPDLQLNPAAPGPSLATLGGKARRPSILVRHSVVGVVEGAPSPQAQGEGGEHLPQIHKTVRF